MQSNELVSQILAMIAEDRGVHGILDELLGANGCRLDVRPARHFAARGEVLTFYELARRALLSCDEVVCGYQLSGSPEDTVLNPDNKVGW